MCVSVCVCVFYIDDHLLAHRASFKEKTEKKNLDNSDEININSACSTLINGDR